MALDAAPPHARGWWLAVYRVRLGRSIRTGRARHQRTPPPTQGW
ncbi:hypothetical protein BU14_0371s0021 [Porphyra umbilicalis]|uniref:Uncharacterized protein n=1 Tax=Porphyra umbilicalis TaxID=2786 RepID=A0A1X6NX56_PORUM|nr:hypothetical protein BU14_0371s0021 [Porphyra umbilicalis]|eukprot:OSX73188.1 hypothetical protein BU14_0371s0021 [Porphyra umbilicalis]